MLLQTFSRSAGRGHTFVHATPALSCTGRDVILHLHVQTECMAPHMPATMPEPQGGIVAAAGKACG